MTELDAVENREALDFITENEDLLLSVLYIRHDGDNGEGALIAFARILTPILRVYPAEWLPPSSVELSRLGFQEIPVISEANGGN